MASKRNFIVQFSYNYITNMMASSANINSSNMGWSKFSQSNRSKEKQFISKGLIGTGSFGEVQKCESTETGKIYAVKSIMVNRLYLDAIEEQAKTMRMINSQYVLQLNDSFYDDSLGSYILVTPYYKSGSFEQMMTKQWDFEEIILFFYQIAKGHFDLSTCGICHLDLKPQNILLESQTQYVICDLGCSRKLQQQGNMMNSFNALKISTNARGGGTTQYGSPDLVINGQMTDFSDIWSLGVILYKIIYKKHPLMIIPSGYSNRLANFLKGDAKIEYPQNDRYQKFRPIVQMLKRMLVCSRNKQMRIRWKQILQKIYQTVKIPTTQRQYIITNFDSLLKFTDNVMITLSALLHYIDQFKSYFAQKEVDTKAVNKDICIYLLTITKELVTQTGTISQDFWQFFLFQATRKHLTKKQKSYAGYLQKEALQLAKERGVNIQIQNVLVAWERLMISCGKLYKAIKAIQLPENVVKKVQMGKIISITNFVTFQNKLQYKSKKNLDQFVSKLINS